MKTFHSEMDKLLKEKIIKNRYDIIAVLLIILTVSCFLHFTETIDSGYHFVDDHEILRIESDLRVNSFREVSENWIHDDIKIIGRFRPLYYLHRVFEAKIFGSDLKAWSVYTCFLACLTMISFYSALRYLKFRAGECIIFLIIAFAGPQMAIWWRLGPSETIGITFMAISFFFMSLALVKTKNNIPDLLFILFLILASLCKESLIVSIPAFLFFRIYYEKSKSNIKWIDALKHNKLMSVPLVIAVIEMTYMYLNAVSIPSNATGFTEILKGIISNIVILVKTYPLLGLSGLIFIIISIVTKGRLIKFNILPVIFLVLLLVPCLVLYSQAGFYERYLLPSSIGFGFLIANLINGIDGSFKRIKIISYTLVIISISPLLMTSYEAATAFSREGRSISALLSAIKNSYRNGASVLLVVDPVEYYEQSYSLKKYLFLSESINLYGFPVIDKSMDEISESLLNGWNTYFRDARFENLNSPPDLIIFLDDKLIEDFFSDTRLSQNDYSIVTLGNPAYKLLEYKTF